MFILCKILVISDTRVTNLIGRTEVNRDIGQIRFQKFNYKGKAGILISELFYFIFTFASFIDIDT